MHFSTTLSVLLMAAAVSASPAALGRRHYGYDSGTPANVSLVTATVQPIPFYPPTGTAPSMSEPAETDIDPSGNVTVQAATGPGTGTGTSIPCTPTTKTKVVTTTLTYTLGIGASATVTATTIVRTVTEIDYITQVVSPEDESSPTMVYTNTALPTGTHDAKTTTISSTSTFTKIITVYAHPKTDVEAATGYAHPEMAVQAATGECKSPVTVTVTAPGSTSTVTVTVSPSSTTIEPVLASSGHYGNGTVGTNLPGSMMSHSTGHISKPTTHVGYEY